MSEDLDSKAVKPVTQPSTSSSPSNAKTSPVERVHPTFLHEGEDSMSLVLNAWNDSHSASAGGGAAPATEQNAGGYAIFEKISSTPAEYTCVKTNDSFLRHLSLEKIEGKSTLQIFPEEHEEWIKRFEQVAASGEMHRLDKQFENPARSIELQVVPVSTGEGARIAVTTLDTSEKARTKLHLLESRARLQAVFDSTYEFIGLLSVEGTVLELNKAALEWTGAARSDVIGKTFLNTPWCSTNPESSREIAVALTRAGKGEPVRQELTLTSASGTRRSIDFSLHPIRDGAGKILLLVLEGRDITDRKLAEEQLRRRYADGQTLTEVNRALVGAFAFDQVTELICKAARDLTGADGATFVVRENNRVRYAAENAIEPLWKGQDFPIECCVSGWSMLHRHSAVIEDIFVDPRVPHEAYRSTFVKSMVMTPVGPGMPIASIGVYWSKRHKASDYEVELLRSLASAADLALGGVRAFDETREAWRQAQEASRLKDEFLATLSHELRNPLNNIVGFSQVLLRSQEGKDSPLVGQTADVIHRNARAQAQLINDLLDLSRLHTGKLNLEKKLTALGTILEDTVESVREETVEKGIVLQTEIAEEALTVNGDSTRLQQVLWNLINNAIKFTTKGGVISVSLTREHDSARIEVCDNGEGISPEFIPHVFDMFRQGDSSARRKFGGLGIGLALVKQITELHDGKVEVTSEGSGCGAKFSIILPLYLDASIAPPAHIEKPRTRLTGCHILVVDDTLDSLKMLDALLTGEGAIVQTAENGADALKAATNMFFDLIISDISMPGMDGYEFLQRLRAEGAQYQNIPAIALTGFGRDEDVARARSAGFETHLTKPLDVENLLQVATEAISKDRARALEPQVITMMAHH